MGKSLGAGVFMADDFNYSAPPSSRQHGDTKGCTHRSHKEVLD